ncbi:serine hydrolase [Gephyromycinifex aptenodytis]|uniref:serine hydrolase n=1 Tax=Gephyromycinifex aptenodytis TaxID=2716227 RepID=UPI00144586EC|nr:serine hydrolase [Gephyromycinifex aptenodytis]
MRACSSWLFVAVLAGSVSLAGCSGIPPEPFVVSDAASRAAAAQTQANELSASFAALASTAGGQIAVAWAPVGQPEKVQHLGFTTDDDAWSTMKVPIALAAALDAEGDEDKEKVWTTAALTVSDNDAAAQLWRSLGDVQRASSKVEALLRDAGDTRTQVAQDERGVRRGFGRTSWTVSDSARFTAALPCEPEATRVLAPMGQVTPEQAWGLGKLPGSAFKGGWGPSAHGYLVRQIGLLDRGEGQVAVALMTQPKDGEHETGTATASALATWISQNLRPGDAGRCALPQSTPTD